LIETVTASSWAGKPDWPATATVVDENAGIVAHGEGAQTPVPVVVSSSLSGASSRVRPVPMSAVVGVRQ
jgi:hypothetical protein